MTSEIGASEAIAALALGVSVLSALAASYSAVIASRARRDVQAYRAAAWSLKWKEKWSGPNFVVMEIANVGETLAKDVTVSWDFDPLEHHGYPPIRPVPLVLAGSSFDHTLTGLSASDGDQLSRHETRRFGFISWTDVLDKRRSERISMPSGYPSVRPSEES